jgi:hypothetical protein
MLAIGTLLHYRAGKYAQIMAHIGKHDVKDTYVFALIFPRNLDENRPPMQITYNDAKFIDSLPIVDDKAIIDKINALDVTDPEYQEYVRSTVDMYARYAAAGDMGQLYWDTCKDLLKDIFKDKFEDMFKDKYKVADPEVDVVVADSKE